MYGNKREAATTTKGEKRKGHEKTSECNHSDVVIGKNVKIYPLHHVPFSIKFDLRILTYTTW